MSELSVKVLGLIEEGFTINAICEMLNLSRKQLYNILRGLRMLGIEFNKKYYYDGETVYVPKKDLSWDTKKNTVNIITNHDCNEFKAMVISDLHIGNQQESVDAWNKIYEYCIINNIHIVIIAGDFLDGINIGASSYKKHTNSLDQMRYAVNNYPFDKNIINFITFGNHDIDSLTSYGIDFSIYLRNFRPDIVPIGYGHGRINIKNDRIFITHPLGINSNNGVELPNNYLLIRGHHHINKSIIGNSGNCSLTVPTLSNLFTSQDIFLPGAMILNVKFKNGFFDIIHIENLIINDRVNIVGETQFSITPSKDRNHDGHVKHEEDFNQRKTLKKVNN